MFFTTRVVSLDVCAEASGHARGDSQPCRLGYADVRIRARSRWHPRVSEIVAVTYLVSLYGNSPCCSWHLRFSQWSFVVDLCSENHKPRAPRPATSGGDCRQVGPRARADYSHQ